MWRSNVCVCYIWSDEVACNIVSLNAPVSERELRGPTVAERDGFEENGRVYVRNSWVDSQGILGTVSWRGCRSRAVFSVGGFVRGGGG